MKTPENSEEMIEMIEYVQIARTEGTNAIINNIFCIVHIYMYLLWHSFEIRIHPI